MRRTIRLALAGAGLLLLPAVTAFAQPSSQVPGLHLPFTTPTGIGGPTDNIDIFLYIALDPSAAPFAFDGFGANPFGLDPSLVPAVGVLFADMTTPAAFDSYGLVATSEAYGCAG